METNEWDRRITMDDTNERGLPTDTHRKRNDLNKTVGRRGTELLFDQAV